MTSRTPADQPGRRPVRIAFSVQPQHADYAGIRRAVVAAEEAGADVVTNWDHFFPLLGDLDGRHYECWTMLDDLERWRFATTGRIGWVRHR